MFWHTGASTGPLGWEGRKHQSLLILKEDKETSSAPPAAALRDAHAFPPPLSRPSPPRGSLRHLHGRRCLCSHAVHRNTPAVHRHTPTASPRRPPSPRLLWEWPAASPGPPGKRQADGPFFSFYYR